MMKQRLAALIGIMSSCLLGRADQVESILGTPATPVLPDTEYRPRELIVLSLNEESFQLQKSKTTKVKRMKTRNAFLSVFGLILTLCVNSVSANQPSLIPAWYNDQIEHSIP